MGYTEIPTSAFVERIDVNMAPLPPVAFYVREEDGGFRLLREADQPYSPLALSQLPLVWVRDEDMGHLRGIAERIAAKSATHSQIAPEKRLETLRKSAILVVEDLFENPSPENITRGVKVVSSFVHLLMKEPKSYLVLSRLSSHDPYTLQHSVGTAVNCIILGKKMGLTKEEDLLELGMAGLLHDIGKVKVKREIINKEGPLDDVEWEEMKQHSAAGYELVKDHPELTVRTKRAILEHHEDKTGTGYPHGKKYAEVDLFAKIVAIADVFNALTTNRSYSKARSPFDAFQLMRDKLTHKIDDELFKQMVLVYGGKID